MRTPDPHKMLAKASRHLANALVAHLHNNSAKARVEIASCREVLTEYLAFTSPVEVPATGDDDE